MLIAPQHVKRGNNYKFFLPIKQTTEKKQLKFIFCNNGEINEKEEDKNRCPHFRLIQASNQMIKPEIEWKELLVKLNDKKKKKHEMKKYVLL